MQPTFGRRSSRIKMSTVSFFNVSPFSWLLTIFYAGKNKTLQICDIINILFITLPQNETIMEDQEFLEKLGQRIAQLRKKNGMTQVEFAEKLGIQRTALTRIEVGNVNTTLLMVKKICSVLNIDLPTLFLFQ